ncbi:unnamed protein product [Heterobilharzia americana]|nr:unnamed protein product [Heterobilharzia americana]
MIPRDKRFEYFAQRSCNFIISRLTTEKMPYYERPYCGVAEFIPSDRNTVFAMHDIVYNSIRATQLSDTLLMDTFIHNSNFQNVSLNLNEISFRIVPNTMKRKCSDCQEICPKHSYCVDAMDGIKCVCRFGWQQVGGYSRSEHCECKPIHFA